MENKISGNSVITLTDMAKICMDVLRFSRRHNLQLRFARLLHPQGKSYNKYYGILRKIVNDHSVENAPRRYAVGKMMKKINAASEKVGKARIVFFCPRTKSICEQNIGIRKGCIKYGQAIKGIPVGKGYYECHKILSGEYCGSIHSLDLLRSNKDPQFEFRKGIIENPAPAINNEIAELAAVIKARNERKRELQRAQAAFDKFQKEKKRKEREAARMVEVGDCELDFDIESGNGELDFSIGE